MRPRIFNTIAILVNMFLIWYLIYRPLTDPRYVGVKVIKNELEELAKERTLHQSQENATTILLDRSTRLQDFASAKTVNNSTTNGFLLYLPHSGYHNQRISLENAVIVAYLLNRTLVVPDMIIGAPIPFRSFDGLRNRLELAYLQFGLEACQGKNVRWYKDLQTTDVPPMLRDELIYERGNKFGDCNKEMMFSGEKLSRLFSPWNDMISMGKVQEFVSMISQTDFERQFALKLFDAESWKWYETLDAVFYAKDTTLYSYRYFDSEAFTAEDASYRPLNLTGMSNYSAPDSFDEVSPIPLAKYTSYIDLASLRTVQRPFLHLGSLFGSSRLHLPFLQQDFQKTIVSKPQKLLIHLHALSKEASVITNPTIQQVSNNIANLLGGGPGQYFSAHIRFSGGGFPDQVSGNVLTAIKTFADEMGKSVKDILGAGSELGNRIESIVSQFKTKDQLPRLRWKPFTSKFTLESDPFDACVELATNRNQTSTTLYSPLVYLATDAPNPHLIPAFKDLFKTFPCTVTLDDFKDLLADLSGKPVNTETDSTESSQAPQRVPVSQLFTPRTSHLFLPFIDLFVASRSRMYSGSKGSTFSAFVGKMWGDYWNQS